MSATNNKTVDGALAGLSEEQRTRRAANPATTSEQLTVLATDKEWSVRIQVARNPSSPPEVLTVLAKSEDQSVRESVAQNPNSPAVVLTLLAYDPEWHVREHVAHHPNTPKVVFELLYQLGDNEHALTMSQFTPTHVLKQLARQALAKEDWRNQFNLIYNPNSPVRVLLQLLNSSHEDLQRVVCKILQARLTSMERTQTAGGNQTQPVVNPAKWVKFKDRVRLASNPHLPPQLLTLLAKDPFGVVRQRVARNPRTPTDVLTSLVEDEDWRVRRDVTKNLVATPELLTLLAEDWVPKVRANTAPHPATPPQVLVDLAEDPEPIVRAAVTQNPGLPGSVLAVLVQDEDQLVRGQAIRAWQVWQLKNTTDPQPVQNMVPEDCPHE